MLTILRRESLNYKNAWWEQRCSSLGFSFVHPTVSAKITIEYQAGASSLAFQKIKSNYIHSYYIYYYISIYLYNYKYINKGERKYFVFIIRMNQLVSCNLNLRDISIEICYNISIEYLIYCTKEE